MHAQQVCHKIMNNACAWMHGLRRAALSACILAAIGERRLSVTGLGRGMDSLAREKHCIKRADRLLSNGHLHREQRDIYHAFSHIMIGATQRPVILVDWSDLDGGKRHFLLRAAVALQGRSLTLYEEVHSVATKEKPKVHKVFLRRLKEMLPENCYPIMVTDSGFRTPWFRMIEALGWDWVGRIRNRHMVKQRVDSAWVDAKVFYDYATQTAKYLGRVQLTRRAPIECSLVIYKGKARGRVKENKFGQRARSRHSERNAHREKEPWLLATSLPVTSKLAKRVKNIYATRMQIEEGFRDNKSVRFGLGFELNNTQNKERLQILLLIASLATVMLWLLGTIAKQSGQHWQYQANTVRTKNVLSVIYLGLRIANDERFIMYESDVTYAAKILWETMAEHANQW